MSKRFFLILFVLFFSIITNAQLNCLFLPLNDGYDYAVLSNPTNYTVSFEWRVANYYKNEFSDYQSASLQPDGRLNIGPNIGWGWEPGEKMEVRYPGGKKASWLYGYIQTPVIPQQVPVPQIQTPVIPHSNQGTTGRQQCYICHGDKKCHVCLDSKPGYIYDYGGNLIPCRKCRGSKICQYCKGDGWIDPGD